MEETFTMDEIIEKSTTLNADTKNDFKTIKQMFKALEEDFIHLLFSIEFLNILTYRYTYVLSEAKVNLDCYTKNILMSDIISTLFRIWDKNTDTNNLYIISTILNKNHSLKDFIINLYSQNKTITSEKVKKIIEQIPHTNKHRILQDIKKYRNEQIGHNSQNKQVSSLNLGKVMIYADLTLKYASNFDNIVLGEIRDYSIFPKESSYSLALEELKKISLPLEIQSHNLGIRKNPLEYTDGDVADAAKQILLDLEVDKDIFL